MKYSGLILIVLMAASLFYNGNKILELDNRGQPYPYSAGHDELSTLIKTAQGFAIQSPQLENLIVMTDQFNDAPQLGHEYSNLISIPFVTEIPEDAVAAPIIQNRIYEYNYNLTMVFVSPTDKYAVIDGNFAREGEILANGAKVLSISKGAVTLSKQGVRQIVRISDS